MQKNMWDRRYGGVLIFRGRVSGLLVADRKRSAPCKSFAYMYANFASVEIALSLCHKNILLVLY